MFVQFAHAVLNEDVKYTYTKLIVVTSFITVQKRQLRFLLRQFFFISFYLQFLYFNNTEDLSAHTTHLLSKQLIL